MSDLFITRRDFMKTGMAAGVGLTLGFSITGACTREDKMTEELSPNAWITVHKSGRITFVLSKSEMGQGILTAFSMIVAEEMDVELSQIDVELAQAHIIYGAQYTAGSEAIRSMWPVLREAGATVRQMLVNAAASAWGVEKKECRTQGGRIVNKQGQSLGYGEVTELAATMDIPSEVRIKDPGDFRLIGTAVTRMDTAGKITGEAKYGIDTVRPGVLAAAIVHAPVFGSKLKTLDSAETLKVKGVVGVVEIEEGIAVVAKTYWQACTGAKALKLTWEETAAKFTDKVIMDTYEKLVDSAGETAFEKGDFSKIEASGKKFQARYTMPFQAHAAMEPMNCTAHVREDVCEVWIPTQDPQGVRDAVAHTLYSSFEKLMQRIVGKLEGRPYPEIKVYTTLLGGGFGRRLNPDVAVEAVKISQKMNAPVKLIWSREEDIQHDFYRPATYSDIQAVLDSNNNVIGWRHRIIGPDKHHSVGGAYPLVYAVPNIKIDYHIKDFGVPYGYWRSVGYSQNTFVVESFIDDLAFQTGQDPILFRKKLLRESPRHLKVLDTLAERSLWGKEIPNGRFRGVAMVDFYGTIVGQVAEISIITGKIKVHRVICVIDCGLVVNPDIVTSQMESGVVFGLTAAIKGKITINEGRVEQSNFHDFPILTYAEMPKIEVHIVRSTEKPLGVGETGVPCIAPAVANAYFAATGRRVRTSPITG